MKPKIIAILGMPGSGKGTVVDYLEQKYHLPNVYFGGMVYDEVRARGLDIVTHEKAVREDMRVQEGPAVLAKRAAIRAHELLDSGVEAVVLDGIYSWSEDKYLRSEFGDEMITIANVNPKHIRYKRAVGRKEDHRQYSLEQVKARDIQEIENIEKGGPIAFADYYLANAKDLDELYAQIDALMSDLGF